MLPRIVYRWNSTFIHLLNIFLCKHNKIRSLDSQPVDPDWFNSIENKYFKFFHLLNKLRFQATLFKILEVVFIYYGPDHREAITIFEVVFDQGPNFVFLLRFRI